MLTQHDAMRFRALLAEVVRTSTNHGYALADEGTHVDEVRATMASSHRARDEFLELLDQHTEK